MMVALGTSVSFALLLFQLIAVSRGLEQHDIGNAGTHFLRRRSLDEVWKPLRRTLSDQGREVIFDGTGNAYIRYPFKEYFRIPPRLGRSSEIIYGGARHLNDSQRGGHIVTFTPRLGRREEEKIFTETSRSPPFAPRLGRVVQFSPEFDNFIKSSQMDAQVDGEK